MKHALAEMTVAEFRDRLSDRPGGPVVLLPFGSQEVQGPHAPMGDYMLAEAVAHRAAELADAIVAPCVPFGHAEFFRPFAGGIQLRAATFIALVEDVVTAFVDHGVTRLLILNGHTTNAPLIETALRNIRRGHGVAVASIDLWRAIPETLWQEVHGENAVKARGHGGDPLTSLYSYLFPRLMRPDLIRPSSQRKALGLPTSGIRGVKFQGQEVSLPLDADEINREGMMGGDATLASAEIGQRLFDHVAGFCADFARHLAGCDPRQPLAPIPAETP